MQNFKLIQAGLELDTIRKELNASDMWVVMGNKRSSPPTHKGTTRIQLRTHVQDANRHYLDIHETVDLEPWNRLQSVRAFVEMFAKEIVGEIGHVRVTNLFGNKEIVPHIDVGAYCAIRDRYHLVINSPLGTLFRSGDEEITMHENELWWFDNKKLHSVKNLSDSPRTHLVFDILPRRQV